MNNTLKIVLLIIITVVMIWVMNKSGNPLKTATTPLGILNLELALTKNETSEIVQQWNQQQLIPVAQKNTYYDFIFLISYGALFYFLCRQTAKQFRINTFPRKVSYLLAYAAILAGIMDILENSGMLLSLSGHIGNSITLFTFTASLIKWSLVAGCISWLIIAVFIILFRRFSGKN
jgi:hypothetical protein